jgi:hypothetical protein
MEKFRPVGRIPYSSRGDAAHVSDPHYVAENTKALKRRKRLEDAVLRQKASHRNASPKAA